MSENSCDQGPFAKHPKVQKKGFKGEIQVIFGPMFSGKTTELLRRIRRYKIRNDSCIIFKTKDSRYSFDENKLITHDNYNYLDAVSCDNLFDKLDEALRHDVIGIDEGQFFSDIIPFAESLANSNKIVIVACLDSDYRREPFGNICSLLAKSEKVTKLSSICHYCKKDSAFTARITQETAIKLIGGKDKYRPVCRTCYCLLLNPENEEAFILKNE